MTMLKHFYNNIKHRARKVSAIENKQRYLAEEAHIIEGPDNLETIHNENVEILIDITNQPTNNIFGNSVGITSIHT
ncbi:unnamed protein product [Leptidea sinapis]|uniref:Uncharacterized protein n=1 Tax=Leptidea sinapis TaxID=189913 RepID=A0A5E4QXK6_9NEOP|nr:unnamed protein product [Leptidea sinapis]